MVEHMHHPLFRVTSLLKIDMGDIRFGATGFFVNIGGADYLVTNKHVFEHEIGATADRLLLHYLPSTGATNTETHLIEFGEDRWITHESEDTDVAILPLRDGLDFNISDTGNIAIHEEKFTSRFTDLILSGNSAIVVGYPEAGWFSESNAPLIRSALISSFFGTEFNGNPCFVMDAKMHNGMSGSPVFSAPSAILHNVEGDVLRFAYESLDEVPELIGIHSGPVEEDDSLDLHQVLYTDTITEIVERQIE